MALAVADVPPDDVPGTLYTLLPFLIPSYYDAAGTLALAWYDELRAESNPATAFEPTIISRANTDWIERELRAFQREAAREVESDMERLTSEIIAEAEALVQKEVARGFRDTIDGNASRDPEAIGWSRHTRPEACKFCLMLARGSVVYRTERAARFAAHTNCHCVARPEFANGQHGPEASVRQYVASQRERTDEERAKLRDYLNGKFPDAPG